MDQISVAPEQARGKRNTELGLIILALILAVGAYVLVGLGRYGKVPINALPYGLVLAGGYVAAHLLVRWMAPNADPLFLPIAGLLAGLGFAMIFRLSPGLATEQSVWLVVGLVMFAVTLLVIRDHRMLDAFTYTIGLAAILLLLLPLAPRVGTTINGARLWVKLGALSFQPAEIAKVLLAIFFASYLNQKKELLALATRRIGPIHLPEPRHLGPLLVAWGVSLFVLFFEKDLGSSLLFFGVFVVMLYAATARFTYLVMGGVMFAGGAYAGYVAFDHVQLRLLIWLNAFDPRYLDDESFQLAQSLFAMGTGGMSGTGLGKGFPQVIPDAETDFIFAAIGEELGLFGAVAVLLLYVVLVGKGLSVALRREDGFGKLLAAGLAIIIGLQAFIVIGGVTRVIPLTGMTLPFVSYGGSSLVANFVLLALLIRVSSGPAPERASRPKDEAAA